MTVMLWNDTTREERFNAITSALANGNTVYVMTARGAIQVTSKTAAKWQATGRPIFKFAKGSLYVGSGRRYDCIDYNHIQIAR